MEFGEFGLERLYFRAAKLSGAAGSPRWLGHQPANSTWKWPASRINGWLYKVGCSLIEGSF